MCANLATISKKLQFSCNLLVLHCILTYDLSAQWIIDAVQTVLPENILQAVSTLTDNLYSSSSIGPFFYTSDGKSSWFLRTFDELLFMSSHDKVFGYATCHDSHLGPGQRLKRVQFKHGMRELHLS